MARLRLPDRAHGACLWPQVGAAPNTALRKHLLYQTPLGIRVEHPGFRQSLLLLEANQCGEGAATADAIDRAGVHAEKLQGGLGGAQAQVWQHHLELCVSCRKTRVVLITLEFRAVV